MIRTEFSPNWRLVADSLIHADREVEGELFAMAEAMGQEGEDRAKQILDQMVYEAPLPPSAGRTWGGEAHYEERSRTGRARDSIKSKVEFGGKEWVGESYVDPADYEGYMYALALENGMERGRNQYASFASTYRPRPFWRTMKAEMQGAHRAAGDEAARRIVTRIRGRFA